MNENTGLKNLKIDKDEAIDAREESKMCFSKRDHFKAEIM